MLNRCSALLLAILLTICLPVSGQERERWYRVEVLIVEQPGGGTEEAWPPLPELRYPQAYRFLIDAADSGRRDALGVLQLDENGSGSTPDEAPMETIGGESKDLLPRPFTRLPRSALEFRGKAAFMERQGGYRTLYHEHWVQPLKEGGRERYIVIDRSGDEQIWPELQGALRLSWSRFLYLETNLWLNTMAPYFPADWRMPAPPLGPASVIRPASEHQAEEVDPAALPLTESTTMETLTGATDVHSGPVYPYRHAVQISQKRKMRSKEVHYLDHPLVGIVVKVTPLSAEDLESLAGSQAQTNSADIAARITQAR